MAEHAPVGVDAAASDVAVWVAREVGLPEYAAAFEEHHITGDVLPHLTALDLEHIGIASVGHRISMMRAIRKSTLEETGPCSRKSVCEVEQGLDDIARMCNELRQAVRALYAETGRYVPAGGGQKAPTCATWEGAANTGPAKGEGEGPRARGVPSS
eukprot:TRINITY_DN2647_c0_g2_i3.p1 TRINITY_DN2647_c0_g2~~TRINITY_DN2647_c0_g2_i3.p1  ORF type:complete len:156 (+),score=30.84 TRINITY_DN2647_c0_g2_i3:58-525(+)